MTFKPEVAAMSWTSVWRWVLICASVLCWMGGAAMIGGFIFSHFGPEDWIHAAGMVTGSIAGLIMGIRFRNLLRVHQALGVIGPLVMAGAFALYVYGVVSCKDSPLGLFICIVIGAYICGMLTLAGLLISLAGWFGARADARRSL